MAFKLSMTVDLFIDAHAHFDDLELGSRSKRLGRGKAFSVESSRRTKQAIDMLHKIMFHFEDNAMA